MKHHEKKVPVTSTLSTRSDRPIPRLGDLPACTILLAPGYTSEYPLILTPSELGRSAESGPSFGDAVIVEADAPRSASTSSAVRKGVESTSDLLLRPNAVAGKALRESYWRLGDVEIPQGSEQGFLTRVSGFMHETSRALEAAEPAGYPGRYTLVACMNSVRKHLAVAAEQRTAHHWSVLVSKSDGTLGVEEAARVCGVSDETIRRRLRAGRFVGARREGGVASAWRIPVADLLAEGFRPRFDSESAAPMPPGELEELRRDLAVARAIADERAARIVNLEAQVTALTGVVQMIGATR